jgi:hypothetical protein
MELDFSRNQMTEETVNYSGVEERYLKFRKDGRLMIPSKFNDCPDSPYPTHHFRNTDPRPYVALRDDNRVRLIPKPAWESLVASLSEEDRAELESLSRPVNVGQHGEFRLDSEFLIEIFGKEFGSKIGKARYGVIGDGASLIFAEEMPIAVPEELRPSEGGEIEPEHELDAAKLVGQWLLDLIAAGDSKGAHDLVDLYIKKYGPKDSDG